MAAEEDRNEADAGAALAEECIARLNTPPLTLLIVLTRAILPPLAPSLSAAYML